ncbi:MAG: flagellar hook-length control protein FliK [Aminipila sp.]
MNAQALFQMLGGSSVQTKPVNTKSANANGYGNQSFKKEMDKAFDKAETSSSSSKRNISDKQTKPEGNQNKVDNNKYPASKDDAIENVQDNELCKEELALTAASQFIQQLETLDNSMINIVPEENLLVGSNENIANNVAKNILSNLLSTEVPEGEFAIPASDNVDLAKLAMLKNLQSQNVEGNAEIESQLTDTSKVEVKAVNAEGMGEVKVLDKSSLNSESLEGVQDGEGMPKENLMAKPNQLDPSKINIKVAEAPIDTTKADLANQLVDKILHKVNQGKHEFELELYPRNLGKINIKMIFANGNAELVMSTSNPKTHQLLSMQSEAMKAILEGNTGMDSNIHVNQSESNEGQFDRDNFQEQNNQNQRNHSNQKEKEKLNESLSFMDRLRLGLVSQIEEAV